MSAQIIEFPRPILSEAQKRRTIALLLAEAKRIEAAMHADLLRESLIAANAEIEKLDRMIGRQV